MMAKYEMGLKTTNGHVIEWSHVRWLWESKCSKLKRVLGLSPTSPEYRDLKFTQAATVSQRTQHTEGWRDVREFGYIDHQIDHLNPFMATIYHLLMVVSSAIMDHGAKQVASNWFLKLCLPIVTGCESKRTNSGCDGAWDWQHECAADKSTGIQSWRNSRTYKDILRNPMW